MRFALAGLILALAVAALIMLAGADPDSEEGPTAPSVHDPPQSELLKRRSTAPLAMAEAASARDFGAATSLGEQLCGAWAGGIRTSARRTMSPRVQLRGPH